MSGVLLRGGGGGRRRAAAGGIEGAHLYLISRGLPHEKVARQQERRHARQEEERVEHPERGGEARGELPAAIHAGPVPHVACRVDDERGLCAASRAKRGVGGVEAGAGAGGRRGA